MLGLKPIESGIYNIFHVSHPSRTEPAILRPININDKGVLVIAPSDAEALKWKVDANGEEATLSFLSPGRSGTAPGLDLSLQLGTKGVNAELSLLSSGNSDILSCIGPDGDNIRSTGSPGYTWTIWRSAPSPPPMGEDSFAVGTQDRRSWAPGDITDNSEEPIPIGWSTSYYPWYFRRVDENLRQNLE